jgi:hypothetical protein
MRKTMKFIGESFHPMMLDHTSGLEQIKVAPDGNLKLFFQLFIVQNLPRTKSRSRFIRAR